MKRALIAFLVVLILAGGYLGVAHLSGGAFYTFGLPLGGDRGLLRRIATQFIEDIQFRDLVGAAKYHSPEDQAGVDIPYLLWQLFKVKPEALDIMDYEVVFVDLDSGGNRARVKLRLKAKFLGDGKIREQEIMLYFNRANKGAPWYMKFEDSLRNPEKAANKKG